jgi:nucleoside-diphosphate-sugar epimerase
VEVEHGRSIVDINVMGTTNLLELARRRPVDRFLYVSSASVYGSGRDPTEILREDTVVTPRTLYELTKYVSELLVRRYSELYGFPSVSVRLAGPYGPMERVTRYRAIQSVVKDWTGRAVRGEPIRVRNRDERQRFIHVADVADAIATVLDAQSLQHDIYNASAPNVNTLGDVLDVLRDLRPDLRVVEDTDWDCANPSDEPTLCGVDGSRLRDELGFEPRLDLSAGLRDYLRWRTDYGYTD